MVKLIPKTKKARERIKQYGEIGMILETRENVLFSDEEGPWLKINAADPSSRWVHAKRDSNFGVEVLE